MKVDTRIICLEAGVPNVQFLQIEKYRSIEKPLTIVFPDNTPVVLLGENNAGKSNIIRALDLVLGESWPGSHYPEDHEFWGRDHLNGAIRIRLGVQGVLDKRGTPISGVTWECESGNNEPKYRALYANGGDGFMSYEIKDQLTAISISADRRLSYQMSYATKWTLLSKLMRKFHGHLTNDESRVSRLRDKFEEIKSIFLEVEEFTGFQSELQAQFGEMLSGMSYQLGIDFSAYDPSNYFQSLRVKPTENALARSFEELGTGQEQVLAMAFMHAYAKAFYGGMLLVIEEPEAHLHPLAQRWLGRKIREMATDGLQILISTHSPAMLDINGLEGFALVSKDASGTMVKQQNRKQLVSALSATGARTDEASILPYYAWSSTQEILSGFFAKKAVLVEGDTEKLALPIYMQKVALDSDREGIAFISVLGKGNLAKWWRLFSSYGIPVYVIFDNDARGDDDGGNKRRDALNTIGVADTLLVEELVSSTDWIIEDKYCIFGADFEATMRQYFSDYSLREQEAQKLFGRSKPLVARHVAENISFEEKDNQGIEKLMRLSRALSSLS